MRLFALFKNKIYVAVGLLLLTLFIGVFGYKFIADYNWIDAAYMTVITITTVGFGEVVPLTPEAKIFTIFLILCSVVIVGYAISVISEFIISRSSYNDLIHRKVQQKIDNMQDHIIICGYGRNGQEAAHKLTAYNKEFVIVEMDADIVERHEYDAEILFVNGNANEDEVLEKAGIARASTLICALPEDADNLFIVLSARQLNGKLKIISRASVETSRKKLLLAGADSVVMPDRIGGDHMASLVVVPDLINFLDNLSVVGKEDSINVEEISFGQVCTDGKESTIKETNLRFKTGCTIVGYRTPSGKYIVNPEADMRLEKDSKLIVIGRPEQIKKLHDTYGV